MTSPTLLLLNVYITSGKYDIKFGSNGWQKYLCLTVIVKPSGCWDILTQQIEENTFNQRFCILLSLPLIILYRFLYIWILEKNADMRDRLYTDSKCGMSKTQIPT